MKTKELPKIGTTLSWGAMWTVLATGLVAVGYAASRLETLRNTATELEKDHYALAMSVVLLFAALFAFTMASVSYRHRQILMYRELQASEQEIRHSQEALDKSEAQHRNILQTAMDGFWLVDMHGRLLEVNDAYCRMSGYTAQELLTMHVADLEAVELPDGVSARLQQIAAQGETRFESRHRRKDGSIFAVGVNVQYRHAENGRLIAFLQDITARKEAETYRNMGIEILQIINGPGDMQDSIRRVIATVKIRAGLDAVGLRLNDGEDFPYFAQDGFPDDFLLTENTLVARDATGGLCRNSDGKVKLECACGLVLSSQTDPANPLFTRGGSFWTNDSAMLLTLPPEADSRLNPRNQCIHQGYASLALVPIRGKDGMLGLLQCNSRKKGFFSLATMEQLEGIAKHVGEAIIRKRMEAAIRMHEAMLFAILEATDDGVFAVDAEGKVLHASRRFAELWHIPPALAESGDDKAILDFTQNQLIDPGAFRQKVQTLHLSDAMVIDVLAFKDGRFLERHAMPIFLDGKRIGRVLAFRDITARKQAEAEKENQETHAHRLQKVESLSRMAGAIAHHFNNQLHAVIGNIELTMSDLPLHSKAFQNLTTAMESARNAAKVSEQLLTYIGQTHCQRRPLDLSETCRTHLPILRASLPENMLLVSNLPTPGPTIHANANLIHRILTNLITNAWEANGDRHGAIRLTVKTVHNTDIPQQNRFPPECQPTDTDYACIEVADTGCGITKPDLKAIFDPFFTHKFTGHGMGLPETMGIMRTHRGLITVESVANQGTTVRAFFPLSAKEAASQPAPVVHVLQQAPTGTVLVVDDTPAVLQLATRALQNQGFTVLAAEDGVQAVELFRQHLPEVACVLCDLTMPRMNGWDTMSALRKLAPNLPVILTSGYSESEVMSEPHPEMPQAFLGKPYGSKMLVETIARVIPDVVPAVQTTWTT